MSLNYEAILLGAFEKRFGEAKLFTAMENALQFGLSIMQDATPVRTGKLKKSEGYTMKSPTEGELFVNEPYGIHVNNGTSRQDPNPFYDRGVYATNKKLRENLHKL